MKRAGLIFENCHLEFICYLLARPLAVILSFGIYGTLINMIHAGKTLNSRACIDR